MKEFKYRHMYWIRSAQLHYSKIASNVDKNGIVIDGNNIGFNYGISYICKI